MPLLVDELVRWAALLVEVVGILVILVGTGLVAVRAARAPGERDRYRLIRRGIARSLLLGLELLVAADIIRTVTIEPSLTSAVVLAIIVAIRTVLSMSIEVEVEGRLPWRRGAAPEAAAG